MLDQINKMDLDVVWSNIQNGTEGAAAMCENVNSLVEAERDRIGRILENLDGATSSLRAFADTISENPSLLLRPRDAEPLPETR